MEDARRDKTVSVILVVGAPVFMLIVLLGWSDYVFIFVAVAVMVMSFMVNK